MSRKKTTFRPFTGPGSQFFEQGFFLTDHLRETPIFDSARCLLFAELLEERGKTPVLASKLRGIAETEASVKYYWLMVY
jgi:hypothetical protein